MIELKQNTVLYALGVLALLHVTRTLFGSGSVPEISADQLKAKMDAGGKVATIYVLDKQSFARRHIPGSQSIPVSQLTQTCKDWDKSMEIVAYCMRGNTSKIAASTLQSMGFTNVYSLAGGILGWMNKGYPSSTE